MAMKGPYREFIAIGPQTVWLTVPAGISSRQGFLFVAGNTIPIERSGSTAIVTVPSFAITRWLPSTCDTFFGIGNPGLRRQFDCAGR